MYERTFSVFLFTMYFLNLFRFLSFHSAVLVVRGTGQTLEVTPRRIYCVLFSVFCVLSNVYELFTLAAAAYPEAAARFN